MPRLGDGVDGSGGRGGGRPSGGAGAAIAYPNARRSSFLQIVIIVMFISMLRNIFFTDYRSAEINHLRAAGKTEEEIEQLIPKTPSERAQKRRSELSEFEQLKADIAQLQQEVKELRAKVFPGEENAEDKGGLEVVDETEKAVDTDENQDKKDAADNKAEAETKL